MFTELQPSENEFVKLFYVFFRNVQKCYFFEVQSLDLEKWWLLKKSAKMGENVEKERNAVHRCNERIAASWRSAPHMWQTIQFSSHLYGCL